jgi:hypothetical protein
MSMTGARAVRVARRRGTAEPHAVRLATPAAPTPSDVPDLPFERRPNLAATRRAVRLSILYAGGIAAVYVSLAEVADAGPAGGSPGTLTVLLDLGLLAALLAALGVVVALGAAPRAVELSERETVVVGRFGRRYRFPGRGQLRATVLQRFPAGLLSPTTLESVEIAGGSSRRSFLLEEHLLDGTEPADGGRP